MKIRRIPFTEVNPWLYMIEVGKVCATTANLSKFSGLLWQVTTEDITEFDYKFMLKLQRNGFSVYVGYPTIWTD